MFCPFGEKEGKLERKTREGKELMRGPDVIVSDSASSCFATCIEDKKKPELTYPVGRRGT